MNQKKIISNFISSQMLGVVATINKKGKPEATLIAVTELDNLELVFGTYNTSRKYRNLINDPSVAIVIGNDVEEAVTVQYEGIAEELFGEELERCRSLHIKKHPTSEKYAFMEEERFFKVKPNWIRYSDLHADPEVEFELRP